MIQVVRLTFLASLLFVWFSGSGHGYPIQDSGVENLVFGMERQLKGGDRRSALFAVYDNLDRCPRKYYDTTILSPYSRHFVGVDLLVTNPPVRIAIYPSETLEERLTRRLYADLKLRMLVEEYEALQQRTRMLLGGTAAGSGHSRPMVAWRNENMSSAGELAGASSVQEKKEVMEREYRNSAEQAAPLNESQQDKPISPHAHPKTLAGLVDRLLSLEHNQIHEAQGPGSHLDSHSVTGRSTSKGDSSEPQDPADNRASPAAKHESVEKENLPWIVTLSLRIISFFFSHKQEVLVLFLILVGMVALLGSLRPR